MYRQIAMALLFCSPAIASDLKKSDDQRLAHILGTMTVLYSSESLPRITVLQSWETLGECSGLFESCPNARLLISVSTFDLYDVPGLFELPKSKGWELVKVKETADEIFVILKTTLDHANIEILSREEW